MQNLSFTKRTLALILTALIILPLVSACHGSRGLDEFIVPESFDESREYELTFWAKNDTNKNQTAIYERAIAEFEALYPNIHVNLRLYTDYGKIYNDVITNIPTLTTPNVCVTYPDHIATYLTGENTVVPLDALMDDGRYGLSGSELRFDAPAREELIEKFLGECSIEGSTYAMPFMRSTEACYINRDYVEKLGFTLPDVLTWDFMFEVAEAATKKNADGTFALNSQNVMIPIIYKSTDNMMIQMLAQKAAPYSTDAGEILIFNDTTRELLNTVAAHAKTGAFSTFKISSYPANFLNAGQCVFAIDSTAGSTWMGPRAPLSDISADKLVDFDTAVMTVPQFDTANPRMISQGPSVCVFNKKDPGEVLASWLLVEYLLTDGIQTAYSMTEGYVPVTAKAQASEEYRAYLESEDDGTPAHYCVKLKAVKLLLDNIDNTFVTPVFNGSASLRDAAGQLIENTTKSVRRSETVDDAYMTKLFSDVAALYRLDTAQAGTAPSGAAQDELSPGERDLGELPKTAKALIGALALAWALIGAYFIASRIKKRKKGQ